VLPIWIVIFCLLLFVDCVCFRTAWSGLKLQGALYNAMLIKRQLSDGKTRIYGIIPVGKSKKIGTVTFSHPIKGKLKISGL
jgi:hypothetical protein